jgi:hypothetical protein
MANCKYCGQKAGFLKDKHPDCLKKYDEGKNMIVDLVRTMIIGDIDFDHMDTLIEKISSERFIDKTEVIPLIIKGFDCAVEDVTDSDMVLSKEDDEKIIRFKDHYNFDQNVIDRNGSLQKIAKASIIRRIIDGSFNESEISINGALPFIMGKEEILVWIFPVCSLYEQVTHTEYYGRSQGISIRVAKGLYYRTGTFKGRPVKITETKLTTQGSVGITNKYIYFSSPLKTFKIPYQKIIKIDPYSDGIGIQKDAVSSKPLIIKGVDGWFTYNVITGYIHQQP